MGSECEANMSLRAERPTARFSTFRKLFCDSAKTNSPRCNNYDFCSANGTYGCDIDKRLRAIAAVIATALAAFAISYLGHLSKTGAGATTGLLATLGATGGACSLQDMLVAVPFGFLIWHGAPPLKKVRAS